MQSVVSSFYLESYPLVGSGFEHVSYCDKVKYFYAICQGTYFITRLFNPQYLQDCFDCEVKPLMIERVKQIAFHPRTEFRYYG